MGSAVGLYEVSAALVPDPPAKTFAGWIAVLQPTSLIDSDVQVRVDASALDHASEPRMAYSVAVCGSRPFTGYLLIGGDARLRGATVEASSATARQLPDGDLTVTNIGDGSVSAYRAVQVVQVAVNNPPRCLGTVQDEFYIGDGFRLEGLASAPVVTSDGGFILESSVERWSMPQVGGLPGAPPQQLGVFRINGAIRGDFARPAAFAATVDAGPVPLDLDLTDARPPTQTVVASLGPTPATHPLGGGGGGALPWSLGAVNREDLVKSSGLALLSPRVRDR